MLMILFLFLKKIEKQVRAYTAFRISVDVLSTYPRSSSSSKIRRKRKWLSKTKEYNFNKLMLVL